MGSEESEDEAGDLTLTQPISNRRKSHHPGDFAQR